MKVARAALAALALLSAGPAFAEHGGSLDDQMACTPDVYRLCSSKIPDEDAIVACLEKNRETLSTACRKVFSDPAPAGGETKTDSE